MAERGGLFNEEPEERVANEEPSLVTLRRDRLRELYKNEKPSAGAADALASICCSLYVVRYVRVVS